VLAGPNGAGKTTLLAALRGRHLPASGTVHRQGAVALLAQRGGLDRSFPATCRDAVCLALAAQAGPFRQVPDGAARADAALARVGLAPLADRTLAALSAGQFQRLLFARLLVQDAPILLLDEPFNAVDEATTDALLGVVRSLRDAGRTVVIVLHDLAQARALADEVLLLARTAIAWGPAETALSPANLRQARDAMVRWGEALAA
jgi:zinc/manganese transport system ATP-binding protein